MAKVAVTRILYVDRLQILANPHSLFWNTRFISDILKARMKEKKKLHNITQLPPVCLERAQLCKTNAKTRQNSERFLKLPNTRRGQNPDVLL